MVHDADNDDLLDRERWGQAVALLRNRAGLTQEQAAERFGHSKQAWQQIEAGSIRAVFRPAYQRRIVAALDRSHEELLMVFASLDAREPVPASAMSDRGRAAPERGSDVVPLTGRIQAGVWVPVGDLTDAARRPSGLLRDRKYEGAEQYVRPFVGESMNLANVLDGDLVHLAATADFTYWPMNDHLVEVERLRRGDDGEIERERQIRQVEVTPAGVLLFARSTNPRWKDPLTAETGPPPDEPDGRPRIVGLVLATHRRLA